MNIAVKEEVSSSSLSTIDFSNKLEPNDSLIILGASNSGKTRLCIDLFENANFYFSGFDDLDFINDIGFVPSDPNLLFSGIKSTVKGELELSLQFLGRKIDGIEEVAEYFDITYLLNRDPYTLSGGEAMRVALALVAMKKPKIWILDQIFDWLYPDAQIECRQKIYNFDSTVIVVESHTIKPSWFNDFNKFLIIDKEVKFFDSSQQKKAVSISNKYLSSSNLKEVKPLISQSPTKAKIKSLLINKLYFKYPNANFVFDLEGISVRSGEILAVTGKNGSGKTTFLKNLALLLDPKEEDIFLNSQRLVDKKHVRPREVFYCFQNPDNQLYLSSIKEEVLTTVNRLNLAKTSESEILKNPIIKNFGFEDILTKDPFNLVRSEKRMLTLALGFLANPKVLLFDEPTSTLDGFQKNILAKQMLKYSNSGGIILMISHDMEFIDFIATRSINIKNGRVFA